MAAFWKHGGKPTRRETLVAKLNASSAKLDTLRRLAAKQERVYLKRKTPRGMANAEAAWMDTERALYREQRKAQRLLEDVAAGDRRKREAEPKPPRRGGEWRYHPRISSSSKKGHFNRVELFFRRRDGARMTEHEVLQAVSDIAEGTKRRDLVVGSVRWGKRGNKQSRNTRQVAADFWALLRYGELEDIGEEQP